MGGSVVRECLAALQDVEKLVFEFSSLVMMNSAQESKSHNEVIEQLISSSFSRLVKHGVYLSKPWYPPEVGSNEQSPWRQAEKAL